jgi:hypothetical protein
MPATTTKAPAGKKATRQRAIASYLGELEQLYAKWSCSSDDDGPLKIRLHQSLLILDPWESDQIRLYYESATPPEAGCPAIVAQGAALLLKSASDMNDVMSQSSSSEEQLYALQAELMLDTAIGMALLREAQKAQNDLVRGGEVAQAKTLSRFQHKLRNALADVKKMIGESERERADQITDHLTAEPRQESASPQKLSMNSAAAEAAEQYDRLKLQGKLKKRARAALTLLPSRTDLLIYALLIALAAWLGAIKLPQVAVNEPPLLGLTDLQGEGIFLQADAKPPSLYLEVDAAAWSELSAEAQMGIVESVGDLLAANGYSGALLRSAKKRPLAQWLQGRGAALLESDEAAAAAGRPGGPGVTFVP